MRGLPLSSITYASILTGLVTSLVGAVVSAVLGAGWWHILILCVSIFIVSAMVTHLAIRRFVIHKLKPIYQIMLSREVKSADIRKKPAHADHLVNKIEGEITNWAERNRLEITRLKENEKYRKEYIGNVSHEIKTPIFNVQGYILTLLDGALEDPSINRSYLERAEKSIDRLINIVNDLDQISKLESGVLKLTRERFDVAALAREVIEDVEVEARKSDIKIWIGKPGVSYWTPVHVRADKHYISQVFINLLTNSIRYGNHGGQTVVSFIDLFDKVMIEVSDNGAGIAADDIPRVFERFYRTDKSRSREQGGTGLGLSIVKHIIEAHGESITLRSEPGKGSTFSFTLTKDIKDA